MARQKNERVFPGYVQTDEVDFAELARLVKMAMGTDSGRSFAEKCGTTGATISNITNAKIKAPVRETLLKAIYENADPAVTELTQEMLLEANGLRKIQVENELQIDEETIERGRQFVEKYADKRIVREEGSLLEKVTREILQNDFLYRGYSLEVTREPVVCSLKGAYSYRADFGFKTNALADIGVKEWYFDVMSNFMIHSVHKMNTVFSACYLGNLRERGVKLSIVVSNEETYDKLVQKYKEVKITDYVSVIYVDTTERRVVKEFNLPNGEPNIDIFGGDF